MALEKQLVATHGPFQGQPNQSHTIHVSCIYLHEWLILMLKNVSKYTSPMDSMGIFWYKDSFRNPALMSTNKWGKRNVSIPLPQMVSRFFRRKTKKTTPPGDPSDWNIYLLGGWAPLDVSGDRITPIYFGHEKDIYKFYKGSHNPILRGRTRSPWLLTTY